AWTTSCCSAAASSRRMTSSDCENMVSSGSSSRERRSRTSPHTYARPWRNAAVSPPKEERHGEEGRPADRRGARGPDRQRRSSGDRVLEEALRAHRRDPQRHRPCRRAHAAAPGAHSDRERRRARAPHPSADHRLRAALPRRPAEDHGVAQGRLGRRSERSREGPGARRQDPAHRRRERAVRVSLVDLRYRDDQLAIRDAVRGFVRDRIVPHAAEWSEAGEFPMPLLPELASVGLTGLTIPPEHGGSGVDALTAVLVGEELGAGDGSIALTLSAHNALCVGHLLPAASEEQRARWLPPLARGDHLGAWA